MAPALTEPLSPKEKLSSSAATASLSTRASKKVESSPSTSPSTSAASASSSSSSSDEKPIIQQHTTSNNIKEKKPSRNTPTPTTSTRITRSKDAQQQTNSNSNSNSPNLVAAAETATTSIAPRKNNKLSLSNEQQMGLSAARNSNNSPSSTTTLYNNNNNNNNNHNDKGSSVVETTITTTTASPVETVQTETTVAVEQQAQSEEKKLPESQVGVQPVCKDNSTEQLLADLTNDFEEAITAEICLRNKLPEVTLSKESATIDTATSGKETATEKEKSTVISSAAGDIPVETAVAALQHMESESQLLSNTTIQENATTVSCPPPTNDGLVAEVVDSEPANDVPSIAVPTTVTSKPDVILGSVTPLVDATFKSSLSKTSGEKPSCSRAQIIPMEILPPVGTDSTMTASEIEDNLEERLSQLDGKPTVTSSLPPPTPAVDAGPQIENQLQLSPLRNISLQQLQEQLTSSPSPSTSSVAFQQLGATTTSPSTASTASTLNSTTNNNNLLQQGFLKENTVAGDELADQDIEEVLKAIKGFENVGNADTLVDLNVFFNDVFQTVGGYSNFEDVNSQNPSTSVQKTQPIQETYADVAKKQDMLTSKIDTLLRRMRKLQARHMCKHTSTEIAGLFEWSARISTKNSHPVRSNMMSEQESAVMSVVSGRAPLGFWYEQNRNPVPSAQVNSMLKELRTVAKDQQLCTTPTHSTASYNTSFQTKRARKHDGSGGTAASQVNTSASVIGETKSEPIIIPNLDTYVAGELTHVAGLLHTEMREVQNAIDSDATESSSGGESADEMVNYNNQVQQPLSISKRAVWRYARDRAAIALRWSWLLTQVNDLEVKIRQHSSVQNDANISKGSIMLEPAPHPDAVKSQDVSNTVNNGYRNTLANDSDSDVETTACSRTRGLDLSEFRKRKLFQTTNMHTISKKAARPSTIKCGCQWPKLPCALCTGRADPTAPRALPDTMMMPNRVALLDSGYHPMLCFPEEITHSIHFESICRQPEWQQRVMRCQAKVIAKNVWKAEREAVAVLTGSRKQGGDQTKRRYVRRKERNAAGNDDKTLTKGGGGVVLNESGNGIAPSSTTTSSTPLVANRRSVKQRQRRSKNNKNLATMPKENLSNKTDQQNYYFQTQMSLISSNNSNNKNRKMTANSNNFNSLNLNQYNNAAAHLMNTSSTTTAAASTSNINGDNNFLNSNNGDQLDGSLAMQRSRTASPTQGSKGKGKNRSNRSRVSYDIDNIVIPYSIAAATRVEILPYKEIPTPKWRVIGDSGDDEKDQQSKSKEAELQKCYDKLSVAPAPSRASQASKKLNGGKDATKHHLHISKAKKKDNDDNKAALKNHKHKIKHIKKSDVVLETPNKITNKVNGVFPKIETPLKAVAARTTKDAIATIKEESLNNLQIKEEMLVKKENDADDSLSVNDAKVVAPPKTNNSLINGMIKANDQGSVAATVMDDKKGLKNLDTPAIKTQNNNILKIKTIDEVYNSTQNTNIKTETPIDIHNEIKEEENNATNITKAALDPPSSDPVIVRKSSIDVNNIKGEDKTAEPLDSPLDRDTVVVVKKLNNVNKVKDYDCATKTLTASLNLPSSDPVVVEVMMLNNVNKVKSEDCASTTVTSALNLPSSNPVVVDSPLDRNSVVDVKKLNNVSKVKDEEDYATSITKTAFNAPSSYPVGVEDKKLNNVNKVKDEDCATNITKAAFNSPSSYPVGVEVKKLNNVNKVKVEDCTTKATTAALSSPSSYPVVMEAKKHIVDIYKVKEATTAAVDLFSEPQIKKRKLQNGTLQKSSEDAAAAAAKAKEDTDSMKAPPPPPPPPNISRERESGANSSGAAVSTSLLEYEAEDTSDELFLARHQRALIEERRKFITYLKFPFSTRSRANRRVDSRAESSGANTPDPMSPAPQTTIIGGAGGGGGDNESIPSPLAQTHSHVNPMDMINENISDSIYAIANINSRAQNRRQERRRTTSMKNKELERRSASPEFEPPYEPLQFPLPEDIYQKMLKEMEDSYKRKRVFSRFIDGGSSSHGGGGGPSTSRSASSARDVGGAAGKRSKSGKLSTSSQRDATTSSNSTSRKSNQSKRVNNSSARRKEDKQQRPNGQLPQLHAATEGDDGDGDGVGDDNISVPLPEDLLNEVDEDDYPKHYLAPNDDSNYFDDGADDSNKPIMPRDDSETDDADDPFLDDDPNDPEWKGGIGERT